MKNILLFSVSVFLVTGCIKNSSSSSTQTSGSSNSSIEKVFKGLVSCNFLESVNTSQISSQPRFKTACATQADTWNKIEGYAGNLLSTASSHWTRGLSYSIKISHDLSGEYRVSHVDMQLDNHSLQEIIEFLDIKNRNDSQTKSVLDKIQNQLSIKEARGDLATRYDTHWQNFDYQVRGFTKEAPVTLAKYREGDELLPEIGEYDERPVSSFDPTSTASTTSTPDTTTVNPPSVNTSTTSTNNSSNNSDTDGCFCSEHLGVYMIWNEATNRMGAWRYTKTNKTNFVEICDSLLAGGGSNMKTNKILEAYHKEVLGQATVCSSYLPY